jgi:hypothetical protein
MKEMWLIADLLSFKRAIIPAASAGDGWPRDEGWGWSEAFWCGLALEEPGVEGREDELTTEGGCQDWVGMSWKFGSDCGCCCWELLYACARVRKQEMQTIQKTNNENSGSIFIYGILNTQCKCQQVQMTDSNNAILLSYLINCTFGQKTSELLKYLKVSIVVQKDKSLGIMLGSSRWW